MIQRSQIFVMHKLGHTQRDNFKILQKSVLTTIQRYHETSSFSDKYRSGRPFKTTERADNLIRRICYATLIYLIN